MKLITSKKQDELLKRLTANLIIAYDFWKNTEHIDVESFDKFLDNTLECAYTIGYFGGTGKVLNTFSKYMGDEQE